jgi:hypothetical protein
VADDWRITENLPAVALSDGWYWYLAVAVQAERVLSGSEGDVRRRADALLLVLALRQVVRAAELARATGSERGSAILTDALERFDSLLPGARSARDALEHFDDYLRGVGDAQQPRVPRRARKPDEDLARAWRARFVATEGSYAVVVGDVTIDVAAARQAADHLLMAIQRAGNALDGHR